MESRNLFINEKDESGEKQAFIPKNIPAITYNSMSDKTNSPLEKLPKDMQFLIFSFLDLDSILTMLRVNKAFHSTIVTRYRFQVNQINDAKFISKKDKKTLMQHFFSEKTAQSMLDNQGNLTTFAKLILSLEAEKKAYDNYQAYSPSRINNILKWPVTEILEYDSRGRRIFITGLSTLATGFTTACLAQSNCALFTLGASVGTCVVCGVANCLCIKGLQKLDKKLDEKQNRLRDVYLAKQKEKNEILKSLPPVSMNMTK